LKLPARLRSFEVIDAVEHRAVGKRHQVLPEIQDALRLGDALQIFAGRVPTDERPAEDVLRAFVGEVVPFRRFESSDRRRVEVIRISGATAATAFGAAAADGVAVVGATGDDWCPQALRARLPMAMIRILMTRELSTVRRIVISTERQWRFKISRSSSRSLTLA
jgi:hypothetical protein